MNTSLDFEKGDQIKWNGRTFVFDRKEDQELKGNMWEVFIFLGVENKKLQLTYPPLQLLNDLYGKKVLRIER